MPTAQTPVTNNRQQFISKFISFMEAQSNSQKGRVLGMFPGAPFRLLHAQQPQHF